jgi:DNA-binding NtrC family response regulator
MASISSRNSVRAQVVLLRFLQDQQFRPLGSNALVTGDVRIVAATNANLSVLSSQDKFRRDLFFRLGVLVIELPALRERPGDPELLAQTFLARYSQRYGHPSKRLSSAAREWLARHDWPGNVRELESLMLREFLMGEGHEIELPHPTARSDGGGMEQASPIGCRSFRTAKADAVANFERRYLDELLQLTAGNLSLAARRAGKDRTTLKRLMRRHGFDPRSFGAAR